MAYAHVQSQTFASTTGVARTLTPSSAFTTGSRVFAGLVYYQNSGDPARTIASVTDQSLNAISYSEESVTQRYATDTGMLVFNIRSMPAGVTSLIITMSGTPAYGSAGFISEFTGLTSGSADAVNSNSASAGTGTDAVVSGTATRGSNTAVSWGVATDSVFNSIPAAGTGFTSGAGANAIRVEYATASSGSNQATFTNTHGSACNHIAYIFVVAEPGATNTNIQPSVGSLALTGYAPTVTRTASASITPSVGALALTGIASTLTLTLPAPDSGSIAFTGYAPTVTVTNTQTRQPSAGAMSFTGYAPTVTNTSSRNVTPLVGSLSFVGYAPTVTIYVPTRQPSAGSLAFTGYAPSVSVRTPNSGATQQRNRRKRGMLNMIWGR